MATNDSQKLNVMQIITQKLQIANDSALTVEDKNQTKELKKVSKGIDEMAKNSRESKTKKKEEKREREGFMTNLLENFQDAFVSAKSELTKPFKDASLTGLLKLVLAALPALSAGIIAGVFGDVTKLIGKLPGAKNLGRLFGWIAEFGGGKLGKLMSIFSKGGKLQGISTFFRGIGRFFGFVGKMLKPVQEILRFGFKFIKPFFKHFGKIFKVFFQLGKAFSKFLLPVSIVWSLIEATVRSWDKFASGDIMGGLGDFIGSIIEFFTFGLISMDDFSAVFEGIFGNLMSSFEKLFSGDIMGALQDFGQFLLNWMVGLPEMVSDAVLNLLANIMEFVGLDGAADFLRDFADFNIVNAISDFFSNMFTILDNSMDLMLNSLKNVPLIGDALGGITDFMGLTSSNVNPIPSPVIVAPRPNALANIPSDLMNPDLLNRRGGGNTVVNAPSVTNIDQSFPSGVLSSPRNNTTGSGNPFGSGQLQQF